MVAFRDWLRSHPDELELYLRAKRELAQRTWAYTQDYADAKAEVVEGILARAGAPRRNDDEQETGVDGRRLRASRSVGLWRPGAIPVRSSPVCDVRSIYPPVGW
jgi:hypothetical protein